MWANCLTWVGGWVVVFSYINYLKKNEQAMLLSCLIVKSSHFMLQVFGGNSDRHSIVSHVLAKPLITRYIRIHPKAWQGHISMRVEFYGCTSGKC